MEKSDFRRKSGDLEQCVQHEKGKWLKMDNGFTLLQQQQSDCSSESTLQTKGSQYTSRSKPILWSETCVCYLVWWHGVAFAFAREKLALGACSSGWVVHGRLHSLLSPFAHGYFMGKQYALHSGQNLGKMPVFTPYVKKSIHFVQSVNFVHFI